MIKYQRDSQSEQVLARPARRPLPVMIALVSAAVMLVSVLVALTVPLSVAVVGVLLATALMTLFLTRAALEQCSPVKLELTEHGLRASRWSGDETYPWSEIDRIVAEPVYGRLSDPSPGENPDVGLGLVLRDRRRASGDETDVWLFALPASEAADLEKLARRIASYQKRALGGQIWMGSHLVSGRGFAQERRA